MSFPVVNLIFFDLRGLFTKTEMAQIDKEKGEMITDFTLPTSYSEIDHRQYFQHIKLNQNNVMRMSPKNPNGDDVSGPM